MQGWKYNSLEEVTNKLNELDLLFGVGGTDKETKHVTEFMEFESEGKVLFWFIPYNNILEFHLGEPQQIEP